MYIKCKGNPTGHKADTKVSLRCPSCRERGTFDPLLQVNDIILESQNTIGGHRYEMYILGQRRCPNPDCLAHIFFVCNSQTRQIKASYPAERLDFDTTDIPVLVMNCFEEAVTNHANQCWTSSGMMIRKTLEALCKDRGAVGPNLNERLKQLGSKIILPKDLLDGIDDLRLLGNDAAHIESKDYDNIGREEIEIAIDITKEILKATYQYSSLIKKLQARRISTP